MRRLRLRTAAVLVLPLLLAGLIPGTPARTPAAANPSMFDQLVPQPVSVRPNTAASYRITAGTVIHSDSAAVGSYLAGILGLQQSSGAAGGGIDLLLSGAPASVGAQGYTLDVTRSGIVIRAEQPAGLFAGVQTLRELLPARSGPWTVPGGSILDYPRLAYRGAMLDVSRHFFTVADVEQYIDQLALYKINYLHLHLTDDQGWRLAINGWPKLTSIGASTEVGGGSGGFYTQAQYRQIVAYAADRYVTIVPEIDMPGHFTAALAAYSGELNCDGTSLPVDTGVGVLRNSICTNSPTAKTFVDDVISQVAALTPGPYISIGGDEARGVSASDYSSFMTWAQQDVGEYGKTAIGWDSIVNATLAPSTVAEYWGATSASAVEAAANKGTRLIMAPASHAYLDQKYNASTVIGLDWAGYIDMKTAYDWNPTTYLSVPSSAILGIEAPLWTETADTFTDLDYLTFPRITAYAELGWSPASTTTASDAFTDFAARVAAQGPRWNALGITYYHSTQIPWNTRNP